MWKQTPFYKIYQKIFPSLIQLAVDIDPVTRQLFEPLLFQLIHWFTKNATFENAETMALLDAIVAVLLPSSIPTPTRRGLLIRSSSSPPGRGQRHRRCAQGLCREMLGRVSEVVYQANDHQGTAHANHKTKKKKK
jgi:hypothetical protein